VATGIATGEEVATGEREDGGSGWMEGDGERERGTPAVDILGDLLYVGHL